jgi:pSer/pThr/pTyr-binding forkhead associated (FHA) protein
MTGVIVFILRILLAVSLYAFLVWALYTLWRELRTSQLMANAKKAPTIMVHVLESDTPDEYEYHQALIVIGRDPACELCLQNELVSAQHARLSFHHNQWWLEDLLSTNGTYLNDERVYTPTVLLSGDEVRCGKVNLHIKFSDHQG